MRYDIGNVVDLGGLGGHDWPTLDRRLLRSLQEFMQEDLRYRLDDTNLSSSLNPLRNLILGETQLWACP